MWWKLYTKIGKISLLQYARFEIKVNKRQYKVGNFLFNFWKVVLLVELLLKMTLPCNVWYGRLSKKDKYRANFLSFCHVLLKYVFIYHLFKNFIYKEMRWIFLYRLNNLYMSKTLWNSSVHNLNPQKVIEINSSSWKCLLINSWDKTPRKNWKSHNQVNDKTKFNFA